MVSPQLSLLQGSGVLCSTMMLCIPEVQPGVLCAHECTCRTLWRESHQTAGSGVPRFLLIMKPVMFRYKERMGLGNSIGFSRICKCRSESATAWHPASSN